MEKNNNWKSLSKKINNTIATIAAIYTIVIIINTLIDGYEINVLVQDEKKEKNVIHANIIIENNGNSLRKEDFFSPMIISYKEKIEKINISSKSNNLINVEIKLINPNTIEVNIENFKNNEKIGINIISKSKLGTPNIQTRVNNIDKIKTYHYVNYPKFWSRLNYWFLILSFYGLFLFLDAILLLLKDKKLQNILNVINSLSHDTNKAEFIETYKREYEIYNVKFKFISKAELYKYIVEVLKETNLNNKKNIELTRKKISEYTTSSVLYYLRTGMMVYGFVFFIIGIIVNIFILIKYEF